MSYDKSRSFKHISIGKFYINTAAAGLTAFMLFSACGCNTGERASGATNPPLILSGNSSGMFQSAGPESTYGLYASETPDMTGSPSESGAPQTQPTDVPAGIGGNIQEELFDFSGLAYCIFDADSGSAVLSHNADQRLYIASITKLLTAMVALDYFGTEDYIPVREGYLDLLKTDPDIDAFGLKTGNSYNVGDLLKMLLIKSHGDAALTLAYGTEEISGEKFTDLMNAKAAALGMSQSHFDNPIGLDTGNGFTENYSCASDTVKLMLAACRNETVFSVCGMKTAVLKNGEKLNNTNALLGDGYKSEKYIFLGGKTGSTNASGVNLACAVQDRDSGKIYIIVYLHGGSTTAMFREIAAMAEYICR